MIKKLLLSILFPALLLAQPQPGDKVDVSRYGGTNTTLGQKAKSASIPMTLATEQDTAEYDSLANAYFTRVGTPWFDTGGGTFGWKPWPVVGDGYYSSTPLVAAAGTDVTGSSIIALTMGNTCPATGANALQTRSLIYGVDGVSFASPSVINSAPTTEYGLVVRNIPSGTQTVSGTVAATQSGSWSLAANQSVNVAQIGGNSISTGSGASGTGTQRVILSSDTGCAMAKQYNASLSSTGTTAITSITKYYGVRCGNDSTTALCAAKVYDKSSAATSSDTPFDKVILGPVASNRDSLDCFSYQAVANGLSLRGTTTSVDSSTTSPTANSCHCTIYYN